MANHTTFYLPVRGVSSAAALTLPDEGRVPSVAVLVAPPLVEERKCCLRPLVELARALAGDVGAAVLRVDYPGTGDSQGDFGDFGPADWVAALEAGARFLSDRFGPLPLACVGVRAGAVLLASSRLEAIACAPKVFWDPLSGAEAMRQLTQRRMVNEMIAYGKARTTPRGADMAWQNGETVDLDGYGVSAAQRDALAALDLPGESSRTLAVFTSRPSRDAEGWLAKCAQAVERADIALPPYWNQVGYVDTAPLRAKTLEWLTAAARPGREDSKSQIPDLTGAVAQGRGVEGDGFKERIVGIGDVRGVLCVPDGEIAKTVIFLHGWSGDGQGPHRMFVHFARRFAKSGVASLRMDFRGRGESKGEGATIASMADDAEAACRWLEANGFAVKGVEPLAICSGTKVAIELATRFPVSRLMLLSAEPMGSLRPKGTGAAKSLHALAAYARKLFSAATWRKILRGEVKTGMVGKALAGGEVRSVEEAAREDAVLKSFASWRGMARFVFGATDPGAAASCAAYRRFCRRHGIEATFVTIPHAGHSFYSLDWTEEVFRQLSNFQTNP